MCAHKIEDVLGIIKTEGHTEWGRSTSNFNKYNSLCLLYIKAIFTDLKLPPWGSSFSTRHHFHNLFTLEKEIKVTIEECNRRCEYGVVTESLNILFPEAGGWKSRPLVRRVPRNIYTTSTLRFKTKATNRGARKVRRRMEFEDETVLYLTIVNESRATRSIACPGYHHHHHK